MWITTNWKIHKEMGIPYHLTCLLRNLYARQEATLQPYTEQPTGSKLGKEYNKGCIYCYPANLTSMQSCCSGAQSCLFVTPWTAARQASLSFIVSWSLLKLMSIELMMPFNHFVICCPLLLLSVFLRITIFSNESTLHIRYIIWNAGLDESRLLAEISATSGTQMISV